MQKLPKSVELLRRPFEERRFESLEDTNEEEDEEEVVAAG